MPDRKLPDVKKVLTGYAELIKRIEESFAANPPSEEEKLGIAVFKEITKAILPRLAAQLGAANFADEAVQYMGDSMGMGMRKELREAIYQDVSRKFSKKLEGIFDQDLWKGEKK